MKIQNVVLTLELLLCGMLVAGAAASVPVGDDVCLNASDIDHTSVVSDRVILFHLKSGKIMKNTLRTACPGLRFEHAFTDEVRGGQICSNRQTIQVIHRDIPCYLGAFSPYEADPPHDAAPN